MGVVRGQVFDQQEGRAEVAEPGEYAEQGGLIDQRADQLSRAVLGLGDDEAVEPGGPGRLEVAADADAVAAGRWR
jgi:hypothetical protein